MDFDARNWKAVRIEPACPLCRGLGLETHPMTGITTIVDDEMPPGDVVFISLLKGLCAKHRTAHKDKP